MRALRTLAAAMRPTSAAQRAAAPQHVQQVLAATGPEGLRTSLLFELGSMCGLDDASNLLRDLLQGFPLVGIITASTAAPLHDAWRPPIPRSDLLILARSLQHALLARQRTVTAREDLGSLAEVWWQTTDDVQVGRMSSPAPAVPSPAVAFVRRFAVSQLSSSGEQKIRIVDDFTEAAVPAAAASA